MPQTSVAIFSSMSTFSCSNCSFSFSLSSMARGKTCLRSFLMRALSSGDAFAYSGCLGSFSTKRLKMVGEEKDKRRS